MVKGTSKSGQVMSAKPVRFCDGLKTSSMFGSGSLTVVECLAKNIFFAPNLIYHWFKIANMLKISQQRAIIELPALLHPQHRCSARADSKPGVAMALLMC